MGFEFLQKLTARMRTTLTVSAGVMLAFGAMVSAPQSVFAQSPAVEAAPAAQAAPAAAPAQDGKGAEAAANVYKPLGPDMIKGQPTAGALDVQKQYSDIGEQAVKLHDGLVWIMAIISGFVLALMVYVVLRFNRRANPVPTKTTHNTVLEVVWTGVPILILLGIAIPSISLLAKQYQPAPKDAVTIKVTGYQWYWGYTYPDNGDFEVISNMMPEEEAVAKGFPSHLEVDKRMVVPANTPLRIQTVGADVIHSFAVPSLWFKLDAVPGRLNEKVLTIKEPGIYYGQCSELCGIKHGYMPIAVEAVPMEQFKAWVRTQSGGVVKGDAPAPTAQDKPEAAPQA